MPVPDSTVQAVLSNALPVECALLGQELLSEATQSNAQLGPRHEVPSEGRNIDFMAVVTVVAAAANLIRFLFFVYDRVKPAQPRAQLLQATESEEAPRTDVLSVSQKAAIVDALVEHLEQHRGRNS